MKTYSTSTRLQARGREVDHLVRFGMQLAAAADVYISPSKLTKFVKDVVAHYGGDQAETKVRALVQSQQNKQIASYERALRTSSVSTIAHFKKKAPAAAATADEGETSNRERKPS
ncbi:hypothetical protein ACH0AH_07815 [Microbacterium paludicola]|uniref:hypothetical protein n=1 Tax=Microbacterium paludicola TaxID=300019 RepID=UPI0038794A63